MAGDQLLGSLPEWLEQHTASAPEALHARVRGYAAEVAPDPHLPSALALAGAAAVLGMSCLTSELQALSNASPAELAAAASELVQHELLGPIPLGFAFAHEHVRRACERRLPEDDRRALHATRARQLGEAEPLDARRMRQVGEHWLRAGRIDQAGPLLVEAAKLHEERANDPNAALKDVARAFPLLPADASLELEIVRLVDHAHAARAERRDDPVAPAERRAGRELARLRRSKGRLRADDN